jgi:hypothetical protein
VLVEIIKLYLHDPQKRYINNMSFLQQKSKENINLAEEVINTKQAFYASGVHCAYYACVQLMLHILFNDTPIVADNSGDSHNRIISKIGRYLFQIQPTEAMIFNAAIQDLKALRVKADYKDVEITEKKAKLALHKAKTVLQIIYKNYHI